jgi:hypothetical protein
MGQFESIRFLSGRPLLRELSADRLNTILQEIRRNKPKGERGITVRQDGTGTYIGLAAALPSAKGGTVSQIYPWDIYTVESDNSGYTVRVRPGTIGNFLPTNWDEEFELDNDQLYYGTATINTDGVGITDVVLSMETEHLAPPAPELYALPAAIPFVFGMFENGTNYRIETDGTVAAPVVQSLIVEKDAAAAPGESPYNIYYTLLQ